MDDHLPRISSHTSSIGQQCLICGSPALGMNFGVLTCAPCKGISHFIVELIIIYSFLKLSFVVMLDVKK